MKACTFFGNRDGLQSVYPALKEIVTDLIRNKEVSVFYVGTQGNFDSIVQRVLSEVSKEYADLNCYVVLACLPQKKQKNNFYHDLPTLVPEGIEKVLPRFAIAWRNQWMIQKADYVVVYTQVNPNGKAADFAQKVRKKGKTVIQVE